MKKKKTYYFPVNFLTPVWQPKFREPKDILIAEKSKAVEYVNSFLKPFSDEISRGEEIRVPVHGFDGAMVEFIYHTYKSFGWDVSKNADACLDFRWNINYDYNLPF